MDLKPRKKVVSRTRGSGSTLPVLWRLACSVLVAIWLAGCAKPPDETKHDAPPDDAATAQVATDGPVAMAAPAASMSDRAADSSPAEDSSADVARKSAPIEPFSSEARRVVVFGPDEPLILQFEITIRGVPQAELARRTLDEAAQAAGMTDRSDPSWSETAANPRFSAGEFGNLPIPTAAEQRRAIQQFDLNRDVRVQRGELAAFLARDVAGGRSFSVRSVDEAAWDFVQDSPLFALLDRDQDGQLSSAEMSAAATRLRTRDADDDDLVSLPEVRQPRVGDAAMRRGRTFALELNQIEAESIVYQLRDAYGDSQANGRLLAELDANHDGRIGDSETAKIIDLEPDLTLRVDFLAPSKSPTIGLETIRSKLNESGVQVHATPERIDIQVGELDLNIFADERGSEAMRVADQQAQFAILDGDKNGTLDAEELAKLEPDSPLRAPGLDRDDDGKLSFDEAKTALDPKLTYRTAQIQIRVGQAEDPLFVWLDANRDGRLASRELLGASRRLAQLDRDGDGQLTVDEIPHRMTCAVVRGESPAGVMPPLPAWGETSADEAPAWMSAMDQNGDGEISHREFLGTIEQFGRMDVNGDGFIDASEAKSQMESATQPAADSP